MFRLLIFFLSLRACLLLCSSFFFSRIFRIYLFFSVTNSFRFFEPGRVSETEFLFSRYFISWQLNSIFFLLVHTILLEFIPRNVIFFYVLGKFSKFFQFLFIFFIYFFAEIIIKCIQC